MVSGLLATEAPAERRSATLNLIYLPLYIGGIAGPAIGAVVVTAGRGRSSIVAAAFCRGRHGAGRRLRAADGRATTTAGKSTAGGAGPRRDAATANPTARE
jgi:hypothetical protein